MAKKRKKLPPVFTVKLAGYERAWTFTTVNDLEEVIDDAANDGNWSPTALRLLVALERLHEAMHPRCADGHEKICDRIEIDVRHRGRSGFVLKS